MRHPIQLETENSHFSSRERTCHHSSLEVTPKLPFRTIAQGCSPVPEQSATLRNCSPEAWVNESALSNDPGTQKRRSTRIVQAVPLTVTGVDALGQPFKERTTTVMVNCHGCKYQSKHYVPKNSMVTLDIPTPEPGRPPHSVQGRVVWVQRPRTVRELFQIGLEFETPGNVWGIAFPPDHWAGSIAESGSEASSTLELVREFEMESAASAPQQAAPPADAYPAPPPA